MLALSMLRIFETLFYQSQVGTGERQLLVAEERSLKAMFEFHGIQQWWQANPFSFDVAFRTYIDTFASNASEA